MNWIDLIFIYFTLTVVMFAIFINVSESNISPIFLQTFRYGKHAYKGKPSRFVQAFEVPKSYFKHFYVFAIIWAILVFGLTFNVYVLGTSVPNWIIDALDLLCGSDRVVNGKKKKCFEPALPIEKLEEKNTYSISKFIFYLFKKSYANQVIPVCEKSN